MALLAATCRTCRGECCLRGKDKAYLTAETIQRLQRHRPDLDKAAIVQGYMDATPAHVNEGSCIYHGEAGCGLPLTWRSDTCNSYFCGPVHKLRLQSFSQGQELIAVATDQNEIVRIARFDEENYTAVYPEEMTEPASQKDP